MAMIDPHDDDFGAICNCAVRYAVGRRTYMPDLVLDFTRRIVIVLMNGRFMTK